MQDNTSTTTGGAWTDVVKRPAKKQPTIALSVGAQERYKIENSNKVDPNHDSRFDPVVITKQKAPTIIKHQVVKGGGKNTQGGTGDVDMRKIERGEIRLAKSDRELSQKIQQYRLAKNMTQDQLNKACSFKPHTIRGYENMTAIAVQTEIDTMKRVLGVSDLRKPKAIKLESEDKV
jgi:hypothetical protein